MLSSDIVRTKFLGVPRVPRFLGRGTPRNPRNSEGPPLILARVLIEAEAIPYEPALLRGERLLVLAPHPDDEVIGCGGLIAQHLREHRSVRIVIATDGGEGGEAALREEESRRGVATLGNAEVEFLRFPDRTLGDDVRPRIRE